MNISTIAPYLIVYLLGVATPMIILSKTNRDEDAFGGCIFVMVLLLIVLIMAALFYLWMSGSAA
mgnify:CR=1 FL=1